MHPVYAKDVYLCGGGGAVCITLSEDEGVLCTQDALALYRVYADYAHLEFITHVFAWKSVSWKLIERIESINDTIQNILRGKLTNLKIAFGLKHSWPYAIDHAESEYYGRYG